MSGIPFTHPPNPFAYPILPFAFPLYISLGFPLPIHPTHLLIISSLLLFPFIYISGILLITYPPNHLLILSFPLLFSFIYLWDSLYPSAQPICLSSAFPFQVASNCSCDCSFFQKFSRGGLQHPSEPPSWLDLLRSPTHTIQDSEGGGGLQNGLCPPKKKMI